MYRSRIRISGLESTCLDPVPVTQFLGKEKIEILRNVPFTEPDFRAWIHLFGSGSVTQFLGIGNCQLRNVPFTDPDLRTRSTCSDPNPVTQFLGTENWQLRNVPFTDPDFRTRIHLFGSESCHPVPRYGKLTIKKCTVHGSGFQDSYQLFRIRVLSPSS